MTAPGAAVVVTAKPFDAQTTPVSDRSLDEFAAAPTGDDDPADATADDAPTPAGDTEPSVPTMRWSTDGAACDACGAVVSRRWRDGESFVCADCKEW